jgi:DNA-binding PadR family transcriptional regulator
MLRTKESSMYLTLYRLEEAGWIREDVAKRLSAAANRTF